MKIYREYILDPKQNQTHQILRCECIIKKVLIKNAAKDTQTLAIQNVFFINLFVK
eukprot:GAHX01002750.1.p1 GENE.GAHX01002750.1~~GAHX01002750.1.p1  ORF type:complete len:55 (+),score=4.12 GAHX01002750.1:262-426(+)